MALSTNLQYKLESFSIYFQGGIRRFYLIFGGVCIVLLIPGYFLGQTIATFTRQSWFQDESLVNQKTISVNEVLISETQLVPLSNGETELYVSVNNKVNKDVGFYPWNYVVQVLNAENQVIKQETKSSYLLPDDIKYVVERSDDPKARSLKVITQESSIPRNYNPEANKLLRRPALEVTSSQIRKTESPDWKQIYINFKNNDQVVIKTVDVLYILRDRRERVVGIGEFQFNTMFPGQNFELSPRYPAPDSREAEFLEVLWSVNYLDSGNLYLPK